MLMFLIAINYLLCDDYLRICAGFSPQIESVCCVHLCILSTICFGGSATDKDILQEEQISYNVSYKRYL